MNPDICNNKLSINLLLNLILTFFMLLLAQGESKIEESTPHCTERLGAGWRGNNNSKSIQQNLLFN